MYGVEYIYLYIILDVYMTFSPTFYIYTNQLYKYIALF